MIAIVASSSQELPDPRGLPFWIMCVPVGVGLVQSALNTARLIASCHPDRIITIGTCGALDHDMAVGDLVIGSSVVHYGMDLRRFGLPAGATFDPEGKQVGALPLDGSIVGEEPLFRTRRIHRDIVIGSADQFMVAGTRETMPWVEDQLHVGAVDMESYAIASAAMADGIPVSVIRVVSDTWRGHRPRSYRAFLRSAAADLLDIIVQYSLPSEKSPTIL